MPRPVVKPMPAKPLIQIKQQLAQAAEPVRCKVPGCLAKSRLQHGYCRDHARHKARWDWALEQGLCR